MTEPTKPIFTEVPTMNKSLASSFVKTPQESNILQSLYLSSYVNFNIILGINLFNT